jgi:hypothetical protein
MVESAARMGAKAPASAALFAMLSNLQGSGGGVIGRVSRQRRREERLVAPSASRRYRQAVAE